MQHGHGHANILRVYNLDRENVMKLTETVKLTEAGRCCPKNIVGSLKNDKPHHPTGPQLHIRKRIGSRPQALPLVTSPAQLECLLLVIDEAHEIYRPGVNREFLEKVPTHQRLLLSSRSQASSGVWLGDA